MATSLTNAAMSAEAHVMTCAALAVAVHTFAQEIHLLADETKRRPPVRHAAIAACKVTPAIARSVRALARIYPGMTNREIGRRLGIDGGRVSEILAGKRGEPA